MTYPVRDISTWTVMSQEARGLDPKDWVVPPSQVQDKGQAHWALFKPIKAASYRRCDDWSERIAAELATLIDLPAARVELAQGETEIGIISYNVTPNDWSLDSGDTVLSDIHGYISCAGDDRPSNRVGHNLGNIRRALEGCTGPPSSACHDWTAMEVFAGYLVFDAWIANTDRHAINWGVLTRAKDGRRALAATFDHGSALASGVQDPRLESLDVETFAVRGCAGRFQDGKNTPLVDLALEAVRSTGGRAPEWLDRLEHLTSGRLRQVIDDVPEMSEVRRTFVHTLLCTNLRRLTT